MTPGGAATFAAAASERDALAVYLAANHATTPFAEEDPPPAKDRRIQDLEHVRRDSVLQRVVLVLRRARR